MSEPAYETECTGPDCPQCRAFSDQAKILGGIGEAMQKMLDEGYFYRLGYEMAQAREKVLIDAILAD